MRKAAFSVLGALLIAGSAVQMATASEHHTRNGKSHPRWDRAYNQSRDPYAARQTRDSASKDAGRSRPAANETRSCDIIWCYPD
jgi:hypothetical protein